MGHLTDLAHQFVKEHLCSGEIAIDATCGNGYDVRFLSGIVGETGQVFACDLQQAAIHATRQNCIDCQNVQYYQGDHAEVLKRLLECYSGKVAALMFNLGYLPGGDKAVTTTAESTLQALDTSGKLLRPGGVLSVLAYVGHPGGLEEADAVGAKFQSWSEQGTMQIVNAPEKNLAELSPRLYVGVKPTTGVVA